MAFPAHDSIEVSRWRPLMQSPSSSMPESRGIPPRDSPNASRSPSPPMSPNTLVEPQKSDETSTSLRMRSTARTLTLVIEALKANPDGLRSVDIAKWLTINHPDSPLGRDPNKAKYAIQSVLSVQARARRPVFEKWRETRAAAPGYIWTLREPPPSEPSSFGEQPILNRRNPASWHSSSIEVRHSRAPSPTSATTTKSVRSRRPTSSPVTIAYARLELVSLLTPSPSSTDRTRNNSVLSLETVLPDIKAPPRHIAETLHATFVHSSHDTLSEERRLHQEALLMGRQRVEDLKASVKAGHQSLKDFKSRRDHCAWQVDNINAEIRRLDQTRLQLQEELQRQRAWRDYLTSEATACQATLSTSEEAIWVAQQEIAMHWEKLYGTMTSFQDRPNTSSST